MSITVRKLAVGALPLVGAIVAAVSMAPVPADATHKCPSDWFCAFEHAFYVNEVFRSTLEPSRNVDAPNDIISSGSNDTNDYWCGYNEGLIDTVVYRWDPWTDAGYVGDAANDKIDHFFVDRNDDCR